MSAIRYEYRRDGWPLCPRCGEDELWSRALHVEATDPLRCYQCGWTGQVLVRVEIPKPVVKGFDRFFARLKANLEAGEHKP